ncbi:hypothetical protein [Paenibacillus sp. UNC499MF]|uniref:hypothetical protein n=1 Tax=Paenibacillus sp. UNC499MF TaxID=1502751 RepID=UPI00089FD81E|nr:hypothetical protein [Paenibacillus sp. UNC499MF]SEF53366.1 hypothetical protein SAMN02799616_00389 [Paenibacillus sp. UNC499MF]
MFLQASKKKWAGTLALAFLLGSVSLGARQAAAFGSPEELPDEAVLGQPAPSADVPGRQDSHNAKDSSVPGLPILEEAASILGTTVTSLKESLEKGRSLSDVAKEKGIGEKELAAKLLAIRDSKIDQAVKEGRLDAERAAALKQRMAEHLKRMMQDKALLDHHNRHQHGKTRHGLKPDQEKLAQAIGISKEELHRELRQGKSLQQIAESKGITKSQLISRIQALLAPDLEKYVEQRVPARDS